MIAYSIETGFSAAYDGIEYEFDRVSFDQFGERTISLTNRRLNLPTRFSELEIHQKINSGAMTILTSGLSIKPGTVVNPAVIRLSPYQKKYQDHVYTYCKGLEQRGISKGKRKEIDIAIHEIAAEILDPNPPGSSTVMRWMRLASGNAQNFNLVTEKFIHQNRSSRKASEIIAIANEILDDHYFIRKTHLQKPDDIETSTARVNEELKKRCIEGSISVGTIKKIIAKRPAYERDRIRLGVTEARYKHIHSSGGKRPTRPFEKVEFDHTVLDIKAVDRFTGLDIDRPTITAIKDCYTGYPLSMWVSFEGESIGRVAKAIQYAFVDKSHLKEKYGLKYDWLTTPVVWEKMVLDNAYAHHSKAFHSIARELGCSIEFSAVRSPWEKGAIENFMGRINKGLPLHGRPTKPNEVKSKQSKKLEVARVYFDDLVKYLHQWIADVYPHKIHNRKITSPYIEMEKAIKSFDGLPRIHFTPDSIELRIAISTPVFRTIGAAGFETKGLTYRSRELSDLIQFSSESQKLEIRQDPNDIGEVFICNPFTKEWIVVPEMDQIYSKGKALYQHKIERKAKREALKKNGGLQSDRDARIHESNAQRALVSSGRKPASTKSSSKTNRAKARADGINQDNPNGFAIDGRTLVAEVNSPQKTAHEYIDYKTIGVLNNTLIQP